MKKKLTILISMLIAFVFVSLTTVYAYFAILAIHTSTLTFSATNQTIQNVSSWSDFIKYTNYYSLTAKDFNSSSKESVTSDRFTLNINKNIELMNDIVITSDCNIVIEEGKKINLNGYSITIRNQFDGAMSITGDVSSIYTSNTLEGSTNEIIIDCPYSAVVFSEGIIAENITKTVIKENQQEIINSAYKFIFATLQNTGINDFYNLSFEEVNISNHECTFGNHSNDTYGCIYTHSDLEFIDHYLSYDLNISYTSSNPEILSNKGNVINSDQTSLVKLGIIVNDEIRYIDVHVICPEDYGKAGLNVMTEYLNRYYGPELNEDGTVVEGSYLYTLNGPIMLPASDTYFAQNFIYTVSDAETITDSEIYFSTNDETLSTEYFQFINADGIENGENDYYILLISSKIKYLTITATDGSQIQLVVKQLASDTLKDNQSYAAGFARDIYGNQIDIYEEETYSGYTEIYLLATPNKGAFSYPKIDTVTYTILGDSDNTYEIVSGKVENNVEWLLLRHNINSTVKPNVTQTIFLEIAFDFVEGDDPIIQLSIVFHHNIDTEAGFGFDDFIQYYTYFNKEFIISSNNYTYNDFEMPFTFGTNLPAFTFKIYEQVYYEDIKDYVYVESSNELFTMKLVCNSGEYNLNDLIYSGENKGKIINDAVSSGTAKLKVDINPYYVNTETTNYKFIYVPIYTSGDERAYYLWDSDGTGTNQYSTIYKNTDNSWVHIEPVVTVTNTADETQFNYITKDTLDRYDYISELTVPGLLRYQCANSIVDEEFYDKNLYMLVYDKIYKHYVFNEETAENELVYIEGKEYNEGYTFIETDLTYLVDELSLQTGYYETLRGINHLKNVKELNLNGFYLKSGEGCYYTGGTGGIYYLTHQIANINEITYLSGMTGLEDLRLMNAGLQDYAVANTSLPNGNSNNFLSILSNLYNLKVLYISNDTTLEHKNKIYEFNALQDFASLQEVHVDNIEFESTMGSVLGINIGNIFESVSNSLYGSGGVANVGVKTALEAKKVTTYGFTVKESTLSKATIAIANISYQSTVSTEISLASVISTYVQGSKAADTIDAVCKYYDLDDEYDMSTTDCQFTLELDSVSFSVIYPTDEDGNVTSTDEKDIKSFKFEITYTYEAISKGITGDIGGIGSETKTGTISFAYTYKVERY